MAAGDDSLRIRHDAAVVKKDVHVVLGGEEGADVALKHKVRKLRSRDRLDDVERVFLSSWPAGLFVQEP